MSVRVAVLSVVLLGRQAAASEPPRVGPEVCEYARLADPAFDPSAGEGLWAPVTDGAGEFGPLAAHVYRRRDTGEVVVSFIETGAPPPPAALPVLYDRARMFVSAVMKSTDAPVTVVGYSIAGGLVQYVGWSKGIKAAAFNPVSLTRAQLDDLMSCGRGGTCRGDDVRVTNYIVAGDPAGAPVLGTRTVFDFPRESPEQAHALAPFIKDLRDKSCRLPAAPAPKAAKGPVSARAAEIEWVLIPGGTFLMGGAQGDEGPPHPVTVKTFRMAKSAVTNRQYQACVDAHVCTPASDCENRSKEANHPVVCVDWEQSSVFAKWSGGRLPTEAEWEYAARSAGKERAYPWGDQAPDCDKAAIAGCGAGTAPVCSKPAGNTDQGLCDMAGNTWAWVQDAYHPSYDGAPSDGKSWNTPGERYRVFRGGSFLFDASYARATQRRFDVPETRCGRVGFRPVKD